MKWIIREMEPEAADLSFAFDDCGLTEAGGEFCYNLFIVPDHNTRGFNAEAWKREVQEANYILDGFGDVRDPGNCYNWSRYTSYKEVMEDNGLKYSPRKCHLLKEWAETADTSEPESMAAYLTITTGKRWDVENVSGYCQGDCCTLVYCPEFYREGVNRYGEIWLGCAKEFLVIDLDENGEEVDSCGGYIVADCEAWTDEQYKKIVCNWAGIEPGETELQMIDGYSVRTVYNYRTA